MNKKVNKGALLGAALTVGGLLTSPLLIGLVPAHWAAVLIGTGSLIQAVTKALLHEK